MCAVAALLVLFCGCGGEQARSASSAPALGSIDERIAFHARQVEGDAEHHPAWALLAEAHLDRARVTRRIEDLNRARDAVDRSLRLQASYSAYLVQAAIANFRHRFEEALEWSRKARSAAPAEDGPELGMEVEALIGLGRVEEAAALAGLEDEAGGFHRLAARARVLGELGREQEAVAAYLAAADEASRRSSGELAAWATIRAAAIPLDAGRLDEAEPLLAEASKLAPPSEDLLTHRAELLVARGRPDDALALIGGSDDPFVLVTACAAAMAAGDRPRAAILAERARPILVAALEAEEVYSLGALARLEDALGDDPERAADYAQRHAEVVRDRASAALRDALSQRRRR